MNAITVRQPWAWMIAHAGKDVENRSWVPPWRAVGKPLAIHAARGFDLGGYYRIPEVGVRLPAAAELRFDCGCVVAVCVLGDYLLPRGVAEGWHEAMQVGWRLLSVVPLEQPVRGATGRLGVWTLPAAIKDLVMQQVPKGWPNGAA